MRIFFFLEYFDEKKIFRIEIIFSTKNAEGNIFFSIKQFLTTKFTTILPFSFKNNYISSLKILHLGYFLSHKTKKIEIK